MPVCGGGGGGRPIKMRVRICCYARTTVAVAVNTNAKALSVRCPFPSPAHTVLVGRRTPSARAGLVFQQTCTTGRRASSRASSAGFHRQSANIQPVQRHQKMAVGQRRQEKAEIRRGRHRPGMPARRVYRRRQRLPRPCLRQHVRACAYRALPLLNMCVRTFNRFPAWRRLFCCATVARARQMHGAKQGRPKRAAGVPAKEKHAHALPALTRSLPLTASRCRLYTIHPPQVCPPRRRRAIPHAQ